MMNQQLSSPTVELSVDKSAPPDERIRAVCDHFLKQGNPPTTRQVTALACVSNSGLKEKLPQILEAIREEHRALAAIPDAPAAVSEGFARLWQAAWQAADAAFDARREEVTKQVQEANAEAEGNFDALCQMEGERDHALLELSAAVAVDEATQAELAEVKTKLADAEAKLSIAQARLEERESMVHEQLEEAKEGAKASAKRITDLENALAAAEDAGEKTGAELDSVKAELSASQAKLGEAQTRLEELLKTASDVASLTTELDRVGKELAKERATSAAQEKALLRTEARLEENQSIIDRLGGTAKTPRPKGTKQQAPSGQQAGQLDDDLTLQLPFSGKADSDAQAQPS